MGNLRIENVQQLPVKNSEKVTQKGPTGFGEIIKLLITSTDWIERRIDPLLIFCKGRQIFMKQ